MEKKKTIDSIERIYALRVSQLDSKLLDNELDSSVESILREIEIDKLKDLTPELLALIKCYLWFHTINKSGKSIGQTLLGLKYYDLSESDSIKSSLNYGQNICFVLFQILFPAIKHRIDSSTKRETLKNCMEIIQNLYKTMDFINSLIFIYYGKYPSLWQRFFKIGIGLQSFKQNSNSSELYVEIMTRELLWNSFAEFLTFVLPLINFYRLRNTFNYGLRKLLSISIKQNEWNIELRDDNDLKECGVCHQWPIDAHHIGCRHAFCYYCLMSNFIADKVNGFTCDRCLYQINSIESIKRIKISINH